MPSSLADLAALGQLLEEHRPRLRAMLQRRLDPALGVRLDAEDILSDVFLEARRRWRKFKEQGVATPFAWLYGLSRDCLIEAWRRQNRACRATGREIPWPERSSVQLGLGLLNSETGPSQAALRAELKEQMKRALEQLKDTDREVLWMRHYDGLAFQEIAVVLGLTENAATVRYVRALRRLKDLWLEHHGPAGETS